MRKAKLVNPPAAPQKPEIFDFHGDRRQDNYYWLRDKDNPKTVKYIREENLYFEQSLRPIKQLQNKLYKEMRARIKEDESSYPAPMGQWLYYTKNVKKKQYSLFCRKPDLKGKEQVLLDINQLAKGKKFCDVKLKTISADHNLLAYLVDYDGSEKYRLEIKDLKTNKCLKDRVDNIYGGGGLAIAKDNETIFYIKLDESLRPYQVYLHKLGTPIESDQLIYQEADPKQFISLSSSQSGNFIFIGSHGKITSEVWVIDAHNPTIPPRCFEPRVEGIEYEVDHSGDFFWILTNYKAKNFRVMKSDLVRTAKTHWVEYVAHSESAYLTEILPFKDYLVITQRVNGLPEVRVKNFKTNKEYIIKMKDGAYDVSLGANYEYKTDLLRLSYSSPTTPESVLEYNLKTKKMRTLKTKEIKGHKPANYKCERVWVKGHDEVKIPMTLLYKKKLKKNGKNPTYLYAYGSYGINIPDSFWSYRDIFRLVDRGFVFALAHIRGGSEMGRHWYENGKFLKKKNTFLDFISCAEYLKKEKYTDPNRLAICGGSAGGLLMGAVMNMRPELFDLVVAHVPFVDVLNTMLDKDLPLTQTEYKEWGNPEDKEYYDYIKSYSPYDNIERKNYPSMFVTCGLNDPRVTYWEPAKWVTKLREYKTNDTPILFKTNMGAGHGGASGRFEHLDEMAEEFAFVLSQFGINK